MRVLRLSTSQETSGSTPPEARSRAIAERMLAEATGEPVETVVKFVWPDARLPHAVDRWLEQYRPDIVFLWVSSYPVCKQTAARHLYARHARVASALERACAMPLIAHLLPRAPGFDVIRRSVRRVVGVAADVEPAEAAEAVEATIRTILRHERLALVVRGSPKPVYITAAGGRAAADARWREFFDAVRATSARLHVPYLADDEDATDEHVLAFREPDALHLNAAGHARYGLIDGQALVEAWRATAAAIG